MGDPQAAQAKERLIRFFEYFALTLLLEAPFFLYGLKRYSRHQRAVLWLAANGMSYPLVYFAAGHLPFYPWAQELTAEIWAPLSECLLARYCLEGWSRRDSAVIVAANLFSWGLGRLLVG